MTALTQQQQAEYLHHKGTRCPHCGSENLVGEGFEVYQGQCHQPIYCRDCDAAWSDSYTLTGIIHFEKPA